MDFDPTLRILRSHKEVYKYSHQTSMDLDTGFVCHLMSKWSGALQTPITQRPPRIIVYAPSSSASLGAKVSLDRLRP